MPCRATKHSKAYPLMPSPDQRISTDNRGLDLVLRGGLPTNRLFLVEGMPGSGKTTLALQYVAASCARCEPVVIYEFDERIGTMISRAKAFGIDLQAHMDAGCLTIRQIDPAEISPGQFAAIRPPRGGGAQDAHRADRQPRRLCRGHAAGAPAWSDIPFVLLAGRQPGGGRCMRRSGGACPSGRSTWCCWNGR